MMNLIQVVFNIFVQACGISFKHCISSLRDQYLLLVLLYTIYFILLFAPLNYHICLPFPVGKLLVQTFALPCLSVITLIRVEF